MMVKCPKQYTGRQFGLQRELGHLEGQVLPVVPACAPRCRHLSRDTCRDFPRLTRGCVFSPPSAWVFRGLCLWTVAFTPGRPRVTPTSPLVAPSGLFLMLTLCTAVKPHRAPSRFHPTPSCACSFASWKVQALLLHARDGGNMYFHCAEKMKSLYSIDYKATFVLVVMVCIKVAGALISIIVT